jgi:hypothetical protein
MTKEIKRRRGTTSDHGSFTGALGEITINTTTNTVVVHDGTTLGGHSLAKADASNINLSNQINVSELATADGTGGDVLQTDGNGQISFTAPGSITSNSVGVIELDTSDGLAGTVLTTDGAGGLSFIPPSVGVAELELTDGTDGQVITTDGSGTITFESVDGEKIEITGQATGDMMWYDGTKWIVLAAGPADATLVMNASGTAPEWMSFGGGGA